MAKRTGMYTRVRTYQMSGLLLFMCLLVSLRLTAAEPLEDAVFKLRVNRQFFGELPMLCSPDETYVVLSALLGFLGFEYTEQPDARRFSTACPDAGNEFAVSGDTLFYRGEYHLLPGELRWDSENQLYMSVRLFIELTSISTKVTYSALAFDIETRKDLPAVIRRKRADHLKRLAAERENTLKNPVVTYPLRYFHLHSLGYMLTPYVSLADRPKLNYSGNLTGELLKGSFDISYYNTTGSYRSRENPAFNWLLRQDDHPWLRQVNVFRNYPRLTLDSRGYANAVSFSNQLPGDVYYFDYTMNGRGLPDTDVDIYRNGRLHTTVRSDSLGYYTALVPISDGDNRLSAVTYDRFAEAQNEERLVYLPSDLLRKGKWLYKFTAGYIDDGNRFVQGVAEYGLTNYLTLVAANETMWGKRGARIVSTFGGRYAYDRKFSLAADYAPGVFWNVSVFGDVLNYFNTSLFYKQYRKNQHLVRYAPQKQLTFNLNIPLPALAIRPNFGIAASYYKYHYSSSFNTTARLSMRYGQMHMNISLNTSSQNKIQFDNAAYDMRFGYSFNSKLYSEFSFEHFSYRNQNRLRTRTNYRMNERMDGYVEAEYNFRQKQPMLNVGFTWRLPAVQLRSTVFASKYNVSSSLQASGSVLFGDEKMPVFSNLYSAGAMVRVVPYLDVNGDGQYNEGERILSDMKAILQGARETIRNKRGIFFINLPANTNLTLTIPRQQLDDISWQAESSKQIFRLSSYQSHTVYFPVHIYSEISGNVAVHREQGKELPGFLPVTVTNLESGKKITLQTDERGYFEHAGLTCGKYRIEINPQALLQRNLKCGEAAFRDIEILPVEEGVQMQNIDFVLEGV